MIQLLDRWLPFRRFLWLFPLVFLGHDMEEVLTLAPFLQSRPGRLPEFVWRSFGDGPQAFTLAVALLFMLTLLITWLAVERSSESWVRGLYALSLATLFGNALAHFGQSLLFGGYVPGLVTALVLVLPYSAYGLHRLKSERYLEPFRSLLLIVVGFFAQAPLAWLALWVGRVLTH